MDIQLVAQRLEALGSETRLEVFRVLIRSGPGGLPVGALQARTGVARSTLSHHLHKLIAVGLIYQEREGTTLRCRVDYQAMDATLGFLNEECCADANHQVPHTLHAMTHQADETAIAISSSARSEQNP